jgi:dTDP-glucose 4,6-dehydratase
VSSWQGRRVLVTGAGGFIGSHLTERLAELGAEVRAMVHYNGAGSWGWLDTSPAADHVEIVAGDIADRDMVRQAVKNREIVFHLAALIAIPYSYHAPESYIRTNITGTLNVLQCAREEGCGRVVHTSTSEVYGTARYAPIDEAHPLQGQSPYSASKIGADKIAEAYHNSFDLPVVVVRPFNTFGPRQSARAVIPTIITQCLSGARTLHLGNLTPTRDMNFVSNTVDAFLAGGESPAAVGRTLHFGSGREISVGDLAALIVQLTGSSAAIEVDPQRVRPGASEVERLIADNRLAAELLGWTPKTTLEEGLAHTIAWMRDNLHRYRPNRYAL